jgi:hypothetical protein
VIDDRGAGLLTCAGCERHKATANRRGICPLVLHAPALLSHMSTRRDDVRASPCEKSIDFAVGRPPWLRCGALGDRVCNSQTDRAVTAAAAVAEG